MDNKKKETSIVKKMILAVAGGFIAGFLCDQDPGTGTGLYGADVGISGLLWEKSGCAV
jgi:hypothetical protein